jgi:hypothetical protein
MPANNVRGLTLTLLYDITYTVWGDFNERITGPREKRSGKGGASVEESREKKGEGELNTGWTQDKALVEKGKQRENGKIELTK